MNLQEAILKYPSGALLRRKEEPNEMVKVTGLTYINNIITIILDDCGEIHIDNIERLFYVVEENGGK